MSQRYIGGLIYNPPGGFSGYFDGNDDLEIADNTAFEFGAGSFSVELFVYVSVAGVVQIFAEKNSGTYPSGYEWSLFAASDNAIGFNTYTNTLVETRSAASLLAANQWYHLVGCRTGSTQSLFVNGIRVATTTNSGTIQATSSTVSIGRSRESGVTRYVTGYISNVRILKGSSAYDATQTTLTVPSGPLQAITNTSLLTCAYPTFRDGSTNNFTITVNGNTAVSVQNPFPLTALPNPALGNQGNGVYTMSQYQALRSQNLWPAIDPYFDYVTLMLHGNGTNGAQNNTFLDSSTNNFTITRNGNTTQGTFTPYGSNWSNYFDGTGDYLTLPSNAALTLSGDFTIEFFVYSTGTTGTFWANPDGQSDRTIEILNNTTWIYFDGNNDRGFGPVKPFQWTHIALSRTGSTIQGYFDGVRSFSITDTATLQFSAADIFRRGRTPVGSSFLGYGASTRIIKGTGIYTGATITVPTSPLTAITNTSLLTCQSNRFIDNSSNNFTITRNGDVSVQRFSPFAPTTPYAAGTIGGSGYFDGNGDTLSTSGGNVSGTGAFTVEFWMYPSLNSTQQLIYGDATNGSLYIYFFSDNLLYVSNFNVANQFTSIAVARNAWTHVVIVRNSGGTYSVFLNGSRVATLSGNTTNYASMPTVRVGGQSASNFFLGYLSDVRVSTNSALYDPTQTTITVPTAPVTAITNTNLLLNFTNGGIIDNAMMNDLETVGNAQISTSVSKFGGGSIYLDGTDDRLTAINRENFNFGTGDFTVEFWINASASGSFTQVVGTLVTGTEAGTWRVGNRFNSTNAVYFARGNGTGYDEFNAAVNVNDGAWHHVAVTRASGTVRMFVDGTQAASSSITGTCSSSNPLTIGYNQRDNTYVTGYIDDLRITKGYARYTTSFTPQRSQWQDQ